MHMLASYERKVASNDGDSWFFSAGLNLNQFEPGCFHLDFVSLQMETDGFHKKAVDYIFITKGAAQ